MQFLSGKLTSVLFLVIVVVSLLCQSDALFWRRRRRRTPPARIPPARRPPVRRPPVRRPPVRRPPAKTPTGLPYCPLDAKVKIITQKRFGREIHEFKRGVSLKSIMISTWSSKSIQSEIPPGSRPVPFTSDFPVSYIGFKLQIS